MDECHGDLDREEEIDEARIARILARVRFTDEARMSTRTMCFLCRTTGRTESCHSVQLSNCDCLEALEAIASLGLLADDVQHRVDELGTLSVVALSPVVARSRLAEHLWCDELFPLPAKIYDSPRRSFSVPYFDEAVLSCIEADRSVQTSIGKRLTRSYSTNAILFS